MAEGRSVLIRVDPWPATPWPVAISTRTRQVDI
jgi:hypothetical protein